MSVGKSNSFSIESILKGSEVSARPLSKKPADLWSGTSSSSSAAQSNAAVHLNRLVYPWFTSTCPTPSLQMGLQTLPHSQPSMVQFDGAFPTSHYPGNFSNFFPIKFSIRHYHHEPFNKHFLYILLICYSVILTFRHFLYFFSF